MDENTPPSYETIDARLAVAPLSSMAPSKRMKYSYIISQTLTYPSAHPHHNIPSSAYQPSRAPMGSTSPLKPPAPIGVQPSTTVPFPGIQDRSIVSGGFEVPSAPAGYEWCCAAVLTKINPGLQPPSDDVFDPRLLPNFGYASPTYLRDRPIMTHRTMILEAEAKVRKRLQNEQVLHLVVELGVANYLVWDKRDKSPPPVFFGVQMEKEHFGQWPKLDSHIRDALSNAFTKNDVIALTAQACPQVKFPIRYFWEAEDIDYATS